MKKLLWNYDKIVRYFMTDNCFKGLVVPHTEKVALVKTMISRE